MARGVLGGLALVVVLGCVQPAVAQDRPAILPTRDVAITYRANGPVQGQQRQQELRVAFSAGGKLMRVEGIGGGRGAGAYVIVDHTAQRMTMVMAQDRRFMEMPVNNAFSRGFLVSDTMKFVRRGGETVAGLKCTVWDITSADGNGNACITDDGVMLRGSGLDGKGAIVATAVAYAPQSAAHFKVPADFTRLEIPAGAGGRPPGR